MVAGKPDGPIHGEHGSSTQRATAPEAPPRAAATAQEASGNAAVRGRRRPRATGFRPAADVSATGRSIAVALRPASPTRGAQTARRRGRFAPRRVLEQRCRWGRGAAGWGGSSARGLRVAYSCGRSEIYGAGIQRCGVLSARTA